MAYHITSKKPITFNSKLLSIKFKQRNLLYENELLCL